jgi:hypothetical protein
MINLSPSPKIWPASGIFCFCLLLIFIFTNCSSAFKARNDPARWIPREFDAGTMILLVGKSAIQTEAEKEMEAYMKKNYPYPFEFVVLPTIKLNTGTYADTVLYRYALVSNVHYAYSEHGRTRYTDFNFYDRATGQDLPGSFAKGGPLLEQFKNALDELIEHLASRR